jgi:quercetin dioxygenase-like cupin family protein
MVMALMEIGPGKEDTGHRHPFEQCGVVIEGRIEMFVAEDRRMLGPLETYFIPAGEPHGWKTFEMAARILDVSSKQA